MPKTKKKTHETREAWYVAATLELQKIVFGPAGYSLPDKIRIGCGWPIGNRGKVAGQCFGKDASEDKTYEIFITPRYKDPVRVLAVIVHELCHSIAGIKASHKKPFCDVMRAAGMEKKFTQCNAGDELLCALAAISDRLGPYPHAALNLKTEKKEKVGSRLLKVECSECGYVARVTRKWLDELGPPICPAHKKPFVEAAVEEKK